MRKHEIFTHASPMTRGSDLPREILLSNVLRTLDARRGRGSTYRREFKNTAVFKTLGGWQTRDSLAKMTTGFQLESIRPSWHAVASTTPRDHPFNPLPYDLFHDCAR